MKKIISSLLLIAIILSSFALFSSCGKSEDGTIGKKMPDFDEIYKADFKTSVSKGYSSPMYASIPEDAKNIQSFSAFLMYEADEKYFFYHPAPNKTIFEAPTSSVLVNSIAANSDLLKIQTEEKTFVYGKYGDLLAEADGKAEATLATDSFILNDVLYKTKDGKLERSYKVPPLFNISDSKYTDNYLVYLRGSVSYRVDSVVFYDQNGQNVYSYNLSEYNDFETYPIGDLLLIECTFLCDKDEKCDYIDSDGDRHKKRHILLDPAKQKAEDLDLGVNIIYVSSKEEREEKGAEYNFYTDAVEYVLTYNPIKEQLLTNEKHAVLMDKKGKLGASLDYLEGQMGVLTPLNSDFYYVNTVNGYVILDKTGNAVNTVPEIGTIRDFGFYLNQKVYNEKFELILNLSQSNITVLKEQPSLLYQKETDEKTSYYRYDKEGEHEVEVPTGYEIGSMHAPNDVCYCVSTTSYQTFIYAYDGTYIGRGSDYSFGYDIEALYQGGGIALLCFYDTGAAQTRYVRLSK